MPAPKPKSEFHDDHDLATIRRDAGSKVIAPHQAEALGRLEQWFRSAPAPRGGILVLPTGGGKTFTATHFACRHPLSDGHKVLWLAHTHHLLEQAFASFKTTAGRVAEPKETLSVRVVSGTTGHFPVHSIKATDDVLIISLQTAANAARNDHPALRRFLDAARGRLFVVFDEAHHAPAPSYRNLLAWLRDRCPDLFLLGLTATPLHQDEGKSGWLRRLFPQNILSQTAANTLMARGVLSRPIIEEARTAFAPSFDEREYQTWAATHRDLPESLIESLARSQERNDHIVDHYARNRARYGKTLIFADRWFQCEYLREKLLARDVRADAVYAHVEANPGSVEARNRRTASENAAVLKRFRDGELDVLINVRMLTEGTDVPDVQTVFLTRQTTSSVLLTQMVGRALRGPAFGGTAAAYIVSFLDDWMHRINWATYAPIPDGPAPDDEKEYAKRPPLHLVSIELVRRLARQMESGANVNPGPFDSLLPCGWYVAGFTARVGDTDDHEPVTQLVLVFEDDRASFERFLAAARTADLSAFESESARLDAVTRPLVLGWRDDAFAGERDRIGGSRLDDDLFALLRHLSQNDKRTPPFFPFAGRRDHDLDALAREFDRRGLTQRDANAALKAEYERADRSWNIFYPTLPQFRSQYQGCVNRLFDDESETPPPKATGGEAVPDREPPQAVKDEVRRRDGGRCLCCGYDRALEVDHIESVYFGGSHAPDNLQTLCSHCNSTKFIRRIDFRKTATPLTEPPEAFPDPSIPRGVQADDRGPLELYLRRAVNLFFRCAAVREVIVTGRGDRYRWRIALHAGNPPGWLEPHEPAMLAKIREVRRETGGTDVPVDVSFYESTNP